MKVSELIEHLNQFDSDLEVVIFASGENYPILAIQDLRKDFKIDAVELGGGWKEIDYGV